jgi:hypothetical protein
MPCLVAREDAYSVYSAGFVTFLTVTLLFIWRTDTMNTTCHSQLLYIYHLSPPVPDTSHPSLSCNFYLIRSGRRRRRSSWPANHLGFSFCCSLSWLLVTDLSLSLSLNSFTFRLLFGSILLINYLLVCRRDGEAR